MRFALPLVFTLAFATLTPALPAQGKRKELTKVPFGDQRIDLKFALKLADMKSDDAIEALASKGYRVLLYSRSGKMTPYGDSQFDPTELNAFQRQIPETTWADTKHATATSFFKGQAIELTQDSAIICSENTFIVKPNAKTTRLVREYLAIALSESGPPTIAGKVFPSKAQSSQQEVKSILAARKGTSNAKSLARHNYQQDLRSLLEAHEYMNILFLMYENEIGGKNLDNITCLAIPLARLRHKVEARSKLLPHYTALVQQWHDAADRLLSDEDMEAFYKAPYVAEVLESIGEGGGA